MCSIEFNDILQVNFLFKLKFLYPLTPNKSFMIKLGYTGKGVSPAGLEYYMYRLRNDKALAGVRHKENIVLYSYIGG